MREVIRAKIVDALAAAPPRFTRRDIRLPRVPGKAVAVIGPRRAGKTTFLWQLLAERHAAGAPRAALLYFSFEDERLAGLRAQDLHILVEEYYALHPALRDRRRVVFFLDELQTVTGWETFVRRLLDTERITVFLSGSSARLLSSDVASAMRGRAMNALVYPFSFREFLRHRGHEPSAPPSRLPKAQRSLLEHDLRDYLRGGGYPEAQGVPLRDRHELLRGYVDAVMLRDVIERHNVTHPVALRWLVRQLLGNAAGRFSVTRFFADLRSQGVPVAKSTLYNLVDYLETAFLIRTLSLASASERRRMVNPRKVYPIDPGLIPVFDRSGKLNLGHALETAVALELDRRGCDTAYVLTQEGYEVDFLVRAPGQRPELLQVCASLDDPDTLQRECRALLAARREQPGARCRIVSLTPLLRPAPEGIHVTPASEWLLDT